MRRIPMQPTGMGAPPTICLEMVHPLEVSSAKPFAQRALRLQRLQDSESVYAICARLMPLLGVVA
jgi:hypothetical protein